jgi:hypothetical protein
MEYMFLINVREYRRGNQKKEIQRNWQHRLHKTKTNNINKTCALLQTTGGKDKPNIVLCGNRKEHHDTELRA